MLSPSWSRPGARGLPLPPYELNARSISPPSALLQSPRDTVVSAIYGIECLAVVSRVNSRSRPSSADLTVRNCETPLASKTPHPMQPTAHIIPSILPQKCKGIIGIIPRPGVPYLNSAARVPVHTTPLASTQHQAQFRQKLQLQHYSFGPSARS